MLSVSATADQPVAGNVECSLFASCSLLLALSSSSFVTRTYRRPMTDTDPRAAAVQLALLRQATVARRTKIALSLSAEVITMARRAIRRLHPDWTETQIGLEFVATHYGPDLARRLAAHLGTTLEP